MLATHGLLDMEEAVIGSRHGEHTGDMPLGMLTVLKAGMMGRTQ